MSTRQAEPGPMPGDKDAINHTRRSLDAHLAQFRALPASGAELKLLNELQTDIRAFDEAIERVIVQLGSGKPQQAAGTLSGVRALADQAVGTASKLGELNAPDAEDAGMRLDE